MTPLDISLFRLGLKLHKTLAELEDLPAEELFGWIAFFQHEEKEQAKREWEAKHGKNIMDDPNALLEQLD